MRKRTTLSNGDWQMMEALWEKPMTLAELTARMEEATGWNKSTTATMIRRLTEKGLVGYTVNKRTKTFRPLLSREDACARETEHLLDRAYRGSVGLMISAMAQRGDLNQTDIDALYEILKKAEERAK